MKTKENITVNLNIIIINTGNTEQDTRLNANETIINQEITAETKKE